jgi:hypothetical protein
MALAELVERGCIEVIVTTLSSRRCDRIAHTGIERRSRAVAWPYSQAATLDGFQELDCAGDSQPVGYYGLSEGGWVGMHLVPVGPGSRFRPSS